jgi:hypothetical protein
MAINVLSISAIAAKYKRPFSSTGSMVSPKRHQLNASTIAVTQTVRLWLRGGLLEGYNRLLKAIGNNMVEAVYQG